MTSPNNQVIQEVVQVVKRGRGRPKKINNIVDDDNIIQI